MASLSVSSLKVFKGVLPGDVEGNSEGPTGADFVTGLLMQDSVSYPEGVIKTTPARSLEWQMGGWQ